MNYRYAGNELEIFSKAKNWKRYLASQVRPFIGGSVLEVGAGIGKTTVPLHNENVERWTCLEPDEEFYRILLSLVETGGLPANCSVRNGTLYTLHEKETFDTILYIDVLEHIENDKDEWQRAKKHLKENGHLIILSPAFLFLYSAFDKTIGHFRRYKKNDLKKFSAASVSLVRLRYLDSAGFAASLVNRLFLKQAYPSRKQVAFWDAWLIPVSRLMDAVFFYSFGKSILGVWRKQNNDQ